MGIVAGHTVMRCLSILVVLMRTLARGAVYDTCESYVYVRNSIKLTQMMSLWSGQSPWLGLPWMYMANTRDRIDLYRCARSQAL